jgi:uncharacterized protein YdbL (DUF1318 family)
VKTIHTVILGILGTAVALQAAWATPSKKELKKRFEDRHEQIVELKTAGKIGETTKGYLEAVTEEAAADKKVAALLEAENADRKALYGLLAGEQKTTVEAVARQNAIFKFKKAAKSELFKGKDGTWRKKADMLKK